MFVFPCAVLTLVSSEPHVELIPLIANPPFSLDNGNAIRLQGAHGEEIVRSVYLDRSVWHDWTNAASYADPHSD